jgi:hypothetical protein
MTQRAITPNDMPGPEGLIFFGDDIIRFAQELTHLRHRRSCLFKFASDVLQRVHES